MFGKRYYEGTLKVVFVIFVYPSFFLFFLKNLFEIQKEIQRNTKKYKEIQRNTKRYKEIQGDNPRLTKKNSKKKNNRKDTQNKKKRKNAEKR